MVNSTPIPENEPEPYEECITESATLGAFHVTAARVRGKKHRHEGTNCDDWFETRNIDSFVVSAVSDGAGSKKFSRIGAKTSCMGAMEYLEKELKGLILKNFELKSHLSQDLQLWIKHYQMVILTVISGVTLRFRRFSAVRFSLWIRMSLIS